MLYLLKGSRVQEYHHQNVAIVGAPEGERIEIVYSERWITPGTEIIEGSECTIVFADSPYTTYVPIRFGVIESVVVEDSHTTLGVKLTALVRAGGHEKLQELWSRFDSKDENRPGRRFVLEDVNPGLIGPQGIDELENAWRTSVDALAGGYFARSSFATVRRRFDHRGLEIERNQAVQVRTPVEIELELRTPTEGIDPIRIYVESLPEGAVEVADLGELPRNGTVRVPITPLVSGQIQVRFRLLPEPLKSSRPEISLSVLPADQAEPAPAPVSIPVGVAGVSPHEIRRLERYLQNFATMTDEQWLQLYDDYFLTWAPNDPRLLSGYSERAFIAGRFSDSVKALQKIETRRPEEESRLFVAALKGGIPIDLIPLVRRIDFEDDIQFEQLLEALTSVDDATLDTLVRELSRDVLGDEKLLRLVRATFKRLRSSPFLNKLADKISWLDSETFADLAMERWSPQQIPDEILEPLLEWQARRSRLFPYFAEAVNRALETHGWERLRDLSSAAHDLFTSTDQIRALLLAADGMLESNDPAISAAGFDVLCGVVSRLIANGEFDLAIRYAMMIRGQATVRGEATFVEAADALHEQAKDALEQSKDLQDWLRRQDDQLRNELRKRMNGWTLHFVGGQEEPWAQELKDELGLAAVMWHESEKKKSPNSDWANSLDSERAVVVIIFQYIGHALSGQIKQKCSNRGVGHFESNCLKRDVLRELGEHFQGRANA